MIVSRVGEGGRQEVQDHSGGMPRCTGGDLAAVVGC